MSNYDRRTVEACIKAVQTVVPTDGATTAFRLEALIAIRLLLDDSSPESKTRDSSPEFVESVADVLDGACAACEAGAPNDHASNVRVARTVLALHTDSATNEASAGVIGSEKRAPVQGELEALPNVPGHHPVVAGTISWLEHEEAWHSYNHAFRNEQSAERIAERGGFSYFELCGFLGRPPSSWRARERGVGR